MFIPQEKVISPDWGAVICTCTGVSIGRGLVIPSDGIESSVPHVFCAWRMNVSCKIWPGFAVMLDGVKPRASTVKVTARGPAAAAAGLEGACG